MSRLAQYPRPDDIVAAARAYLGTPWRHQGRSARGVDCLGLLARAFVDCGLPVQDRTDYQRWPEPLVMKSELDAQLIRVPKHDLRAGVVAMFRDPQWLHVGLMTGPRHFIHAWEGRGVVEHILDWQTWRQRLSRAWRHPGMVWDN